MKTRIKWSLVTCLLVAVGLISGCGGGHDNYTPTPAVKSAPAPIIAPVDTETGTATTPASVTPQLVKAPPNSPSQVANVAVSLQGSTKITALKADGTPIQLTAAPTFTFQAPATNTPEGNTAVTLPASQSGYYLDSASTAIDVQITGAAGATFTKAITIVLPVSPGKTSVAVVHQIKSNGTDIILPGPGGVAGAPYPVTDGTISVDVFDLCWFVGDPVYKTVTGSTGSTGSSGSNF